MVRRGSTGDDSDNDFGGVGGGSDTDTGSGVTGGSDSDTSYGGGPTDDSTAGSGNVGGPSAGGGDDDDDDGSDYGGGFDGGDDDDDGSDYDPNPSSRETGGTDDRTVDDIASGGPSDPRPQSTGDAPADNQGGAGGSGTDGRTLDERDRDGDGEIVAGPQSAAGNLDRISDPAEADRGTSITTIPRRGDRGELEQSERAREDLSGGLENQFGAITGEEGPTADAVQTLQGRIDRGIAGLSLVDTDQYSIVRENGGLTAEFSRSARREAARRQAAEEFGVAPGRVDLADTGAGFEARIEDEGVEGGTFITGGPRPDRETNRTGSNPSRREFGSGDAGGAVPGGYGRPQSTGDGKRISDPTELQGQGEGEIEDPGEARAAVNRYGQRQLEAVDPSEQFGDVPIVNPFTTGGTADGQPSTLAPGAALATDPLVGDPGDDSRIEEQLNAAGEDVRGFLGGAAEAASEGAPAGGGAFGTLSGIARLEQGSRLLASELGFDVEQTDEGRFEEAAERGVTNAADVFNPPAAAAEGKEIGEFLFTQPPRILDSLAAAGEGAAEANDDGRPPSVSPSAELAADPLDDEARGAFGAAATTPFVQDLEQRGERVAATAVEEFTSDPLGATAAAAGGLAGSAAFGAGAGRFATRVPGISGSDLSGRALKSAGRVAADAELPDVRSSLRRFGSDERGQGDLTLGGRSDQDTISGDDLVSERALAEPEGEGRLASPPDDVSGGARDRQAAGLNQQGSFVGSNTNRQDAAFGGTGKPDTRYGSPSDRDFSNVEFRELDRLRDRVEQPSVDVDGPAQSGLDATTAAAGAGITVPGLLGTPTELTRITQSGGFTSADELVDSDAAVGPDTVFGADVDAGQFTDARAGSLIGGRQDAAAAARQDNRLDQFEQGRTAFDLDTRFDARLDNRVDTRLDTRQDTRFDSRQDTRFDTRFDTRQDTRYDTRFDTRFDTRIDIPTERPERQPDQFDPRGAAGTDPQRFENAIETPGDFLGPGEFGFAPRDEDELEEIDAAGGGFGSFGGGFQSFDGGEQGGSEEIDPTGGLF